MVAACGGDADIVKIAPTMACHERVKCHVISWQLGVKPGTFVSGSHVDCKCDQP